MGVESAWSAIDWINGDVPIAAVRLGLGIWLLLKGTITSEYIFGERRLICSLDQLICHELPLLSSCFGFKSWRKSGSMGKYEGRKKRWRRETTTKRVRERESRFKWEFLKGLWSSFGYILRILDERETLADGSE